MKVQQKVKSTMSRDDDFEESTALAVRVDVPEGDGVDMTADAANTTTIRGKLLKFSGKNWTTGSGKNREDVPKGLQLVVLKFACAWVKWAKKEGRSMPVEYIWEVPGKPLPIVSGLPDRDQSKWLVNDANEPMDPWQHTRFMFLADPHSGKEYTYSNSSYSGKLAITDLSQQVRNMRKATRQPVMPLVGLGWELWETRYNKNATRPVFEVMGWRGGGGVSEDTHTSTPLIKGYDTDEGGEPDDGVPEARPSPNIQKDLDDEIPF
jgi:hypothetical protein